MGSAQKMSANDELADQERSSRFFQSDTERPPNVENEIAIPDAFGEAVMRVHPDVQN